MDETSFFDNGDVKVTNARFIVSGQTYAMNGVTSVKTHVETPSWAGPGVLIGIGLLTLLGASGAGKLFGVVIAGLGVWWGIAMKGTSSVVLSSASGEAQALSSKDRPYIDSVVAALNNALIHRG